MITKNCIEIATNQKYIGKISGIRYKMNTDTIIEPKSKDKSQAEGQIKIALDSKALSRI